METYKLINQGKQDLDRHHVTRFSFRTEIDYANRYRSNCTVSMFTREHVTDEMIADIQNQIEDANTPAEGCRLTSDGERRVRYLREVRDAMRHAQHDESAETAGYAVFGDDLIRIVY